MSNELLVHHLPSDQVSVGFRTIQKLPDGSHVTGFLQARPKETLSQDGSQLAYQRVFYPAATEELSMEVKVSNVLQSMS